MRAHLIKMSNNCFTTFKVKCLQRENCIFLLQTSVNRSDRVAVVFLMQLVRACVLDKTTSYFQFLGFSLFPSSLKGNTELKTYCLSACFCRSKLLCLFSVFFCSASVYLCTAKHPQFSIFSREGASKRSLFIYLFIFKYTVRHFESYF